MKSKKFVLALLAVGIFYVGGSAASASGDWRYGYNFSSAYSNYLINQSHSATVKNTNTGRQGYDSKGAGVWAKALVGRNVSEKAAFYYNHW